MRGEKMKKNKNFAIMLFVLLGFGSMLLYPYFVIRMLAIVLIFCGVYYKKEEKEQEQEQRRNEILSKTNPTPHPDLLACESLQEENTKIYHYIKTLQSDWKKFDGELLIKIRELSYVNSSMRGTKKQVFVNSDLEWIKSLNDNVERTFGIFS